MSADDHDRHNASCENRTTCVFPSQRLLDIQCLRNRGSCVIERRLSNFCLQNKTLRHVENVIMMVNNAGDVFKLCISTKRKHKLYNLSIKAKVPAIDMRVIFHINDILNVS